MNNSIMHRGPDESGLHLEPGVGLGHRRLSIIDISTGQQPLYNEDQSVVVVYNGEIYNFQEIAKHLERKGHFFQTQSDTEVIVHAWEEWGVECIKKFRGMFAFALWDRKKRLLFLVRDRLGIKPLYYSKLNDGTLIFASELKALCEHPDFNERIEPEAVEEYFALGYIPEPRTVYKNTWKLESGHYLLVSPEKPLPAPVEYWDVDFTCDNSSPLSDLNEEFITRLQEAVKIRLISEVPLGAFLSGGIDSSAVVAMMAGIQDASVNTCSISFTEQSFNEAEHARLIAEKYQTNHREREVNPDDFDLLGKLAMLYDEPFADSSAMPTYRVCQLAKENVTVVLSGDGGDENLAGYRRYQYHMNEEKIRAILPLRIRKTLFGGIGNIYPKLDWMPQLFRAKTTLQALGRDSVAAYFHSVSTLSDEIRLKIYSDDFKAQLQGYNGVEVFRRYERKRPEYDSLSLAQYIDIKTYLPGDILTKVDRASMAHALEVRVPLLDHELVEWIASLPPSVKLKGQTGKYVMKKALEPYLPDSILYRKKMGFSVPLAKWFKGPLSGKVRDSILSETLIDSNIFEYGELQRLLTQHQSGKRDHSVTLWSLLMFYGFLSKSD